MQMTQSLSEATAIRLFNSVVAADGQTTGAVTAPISPTALNARTAATSVPTPNDVSLEEIKSFESANEFGNSCRICRWNRSDMQVLRCPCHCKGSVGFIHLQCLKRWILHRRDNHCEICHMPFQIPDEKLDLRRMFRTFLCARCCGTIIKQLLLGASLVPLAHVVLQQVLLCMENINQSSNDQLTIQEVLMASCALLTSSALFFHFFEFITTRFLVIRNILRQWWMFGNSSDFSIIDLESESFELF